MKPISPTEPVTDLQRVPIHDNGEELIDFLAYDPELRQDRPRFNYTRATLGRRGLVERLAKANHWLLSRGHRLLILECWRPLHIQRRMYLTTWARLKERHPDWSEVKLKRHVNRLTAPAHSRVPPPHSTGGAVDLSLADLEGKPVDVQSPYETMATESFAFHAVGLSDDARRNRDLLAEALVPTGITNYPSEYWHWSYGDQGWAYRGGHGEAIYGSVEPNEYRPPVGDDGDEPLTWLADS